MFSRDASQNSKISDTTLQFSINKKRLTLKSRKKNSHPLRVNDTARWVARNKGPGHSYTVLWHLQSNKFKDQIFLELHEFTTCHIIGIWTQVIKVKISQKVYISGTSLSQIRLNTRIKLTRQYEFHNSIYTLYVKKL